MQPRREFEAETPPTGESTKRVGIWIRVSTEEQAEGDSPEHHEERARMYADMKGWTIITVYHLEAVSGKTVKNEPEAKRMFEDVRTKRITGLIFSQLFRLGRNTRELLEISDFFGEHGADLISLAESIDTSTPIGKMYYTFTAAMGQCDREMIAARVAASVPVRAKLGKPLGGAAPFGFQWLDRKLVPHPEEAPVRKLVHELFLEYRRFKTVARVLNEAGHRTRSGAKFTHTTVERLIRDPIAKGLHRANYTKSLGNKKHWVTKPEAEWVWNEVPAIVPEALWEECNRLLGERRLNRRPAAKRPVQLFAGVTFCACGKKMYVPSNTPKYTCQGCRNKIPIMDLEKVFAEQLRGFVFSPEEVVSHLAEADRQLAERGALLGSLEREGEKLSAEMDKVKRLYLDGQLTPAGFGQWYGPLEERQQQLALELPRLRGEIDFLTISHLGSGAIIAEAQDLYGRWSELPFPEKRTIVEIIVERITVGDGEIDIALASLHPPKAPSSLEELANGARRCRGSSQRAARSGPGRRAGREPVPR